MSARSRDVAQLSLLEGADGPRDVWRVRPSERARRLAVRVLPGGLVEIVVPIGTRPTAIQQFVAHHQRWIERKIAQYTPLETAPAGGLPERIHFAASGDMFDVRYVDAPGALRLTLENRTLCLSGERHRAVLMRHALQRFTMRHAHEVLSPWLAELAAATGLDYARIQIRRQRTRWGSCSRNGTISLNACLLFQKPAVVNYLLVHELAHTRHMNHARRFWALVERFEPDWRQLDRTLSRGWREVPTWVLR
ncbi:MAG: SprT family zinc-dependent metalloprotease [Steroidobacteraceae bacterium]